MAKDDRQFQDVAKLRFREVPEVYTEDEWTNDADKKDGSWAANPPRKAER